MRTHDSNDNPTPQAERFDEMTGGYDDFDHARAAKRLNADLRAMDATPRVGHRIGMVWFAPISESGQLGHHHTQLTTAKREASDRHNIYGGMWSVARLEWDAADVYNMTKPDRIIKL